MGKSVKSGKYIRVMTDIWGHPKTAMAGNAAMGVWLRAAAWVREYGDGNAVIPTSVLASFSTPKNVENLVFSGFFVAEKNGFRLHDFWDYQASASAVSAGDVAESKRRERSKIAAHMRWHDGRGIVEPGCTYCNGASDADACSNAKPMLSDAYKEKEKEKDIPIPIGIAKKASGRASGEPSGVAGDAFHFFWEIYPIKIAKASAVKAWDKAIQKENPQIIIEGAKRYAADPNRNETFTAYPATWLNQQRWNDEPLPPKAGNRNVDEMVSAWHAIGQNHQKQIGA